MGMQAWSAQGGTQRLEHRAVFPSTKYVEEVLLPGAELNGAVGGRDRPAGR